MNKWNVIIRNNQEAETYSEDLLTFTMIRKCGSTLGKTE